MSTPINNLVIAEDDQDEIILFKEAVEATCPHISLTFANDGIQLMDILRKMEKPDSIVLDLNLPFKNGRECLIEIRNDDVLHDVPVIIFSTSNSAQDMEFCLKNGANYYYVKPTNVAGLRMLASQICNGRLRTQFLNID